LDINHFANHAILSIFISLPSNNFSPQASASLCHTAQDAGKVLLGYGDLITFSSFFFSLMPYQQP
jgi:hypothetical protein